MFELLLDAQSNKSYLWKTEISQSLIGRPRPPRPLPIQFITKYDLTLKQQRQKLKPQSQSCPHLQIGSFPVTTTWLSTSEVLKCREKHNRKITEKHSEAKLQLPCHCRSVHKNACKNRTFTSGCHSAHIDELKSSPGMYCIAAASARLLGRSVLRFYSNN